MSFNITRFVSIKIFERLSELSSCDISITFSQLLHFNNSVNLYYDYLIAEYIFIKK